MNIILSQIHRLGVNYRVVSNPPATNTLLPLVLLTGPALRNFSEVVATHIWPLLGPLLQISLPCHQIHLKINSPLCGAQRRREGLGVSPSMAVPTMAVQASKTPLNNNLLTNLKPWTRNFKPVLPASEWMAGVKCSCFYSFLFELGGGFAFSTVFISRTLRAAQNPYRLKR